MILMVKIVLSGTTRLDKRDRAVGDDLMKYKSHHLLMQLTLFLMAATQLVAAIKL
jgi:hypothetical protein